jgi:FtsZ-interacting cell division protein ZipA
MAWIKKVYLYVVSLVSLIIVVIGAIMLINLALRAWVFKKADNSFYYAPKVACDLPARAEGSQAAILPAECTDPNYEQKMKEQEEENRAAQRQRNAAQAIAMIIVGAPVFYYHWRLARKEA